MTSKTWIGLLGVLLAGLALATTLTLLVGSQAAPARLVACFFMSLGSLFLALVTATIALELPDDRDALQTEINTLRSILVTKERQVDRWREAFRQARGKVVDLGNDLEVLEEGLEE